MGDIVNFMPPGMFLLADLPQRGPLGSVAFGSGWSELDTLFKFYPGQFTVVTGSPGHGKSTLMLNVLAKMAREQGVKSFLYGPENEQSIAEKMRLLWPGSDETFEHFAASQFIVQSSEAFTQDEPMHTIEWVLDRASWAVDNRKIEVVMIDPWNELEMIKPRDLPMTDYIRECIKKMKDFVRSHKVAFVIVVHPTKDAAQNGRVPSLYDCEGCYTDDTEVLTRRGWLHHGQITLSDDVACFDPKSNDVVYLQPSHILRKEHDGEILRFKGYGYDLAVTPGHRMLVKPVWLEPVGARNGFGRPVVFPKGQWSFCRAAEVPRAEFVIPRAGNALEGASPEAVQIGDRAYPARDFWRLVGWFVSEGYTGSYGLTWAQAEGELADEFTATFANAGIRATLGVSDPYGKGKKRVARWYVGCRHSRDLVHWFGENCGRGAANKKIPDAVFELSPELKRVFFKAYLEGDGSHDGRSATTVSSRLADDLQRLAVELGIATSFCTRGPSGNSQKCYCLRFGERSESALRPYRNLERENYKGLVWCLTVPTGAYFVRRNGKVAVCGNSAHWWNKSDNGLIVHRDKEHMDTCKVISAKVRELGAGMPGECLFWVDRDTGMMKPKEGCVCVY